MTFNERNGGYIYVHSLDQLIVLFHFRPVSVTNNLHSLLPCPFIKFQTPIPPSIPCHLSYSICFPTHTFLIHTKRHHTHIMTLKNYRFIYLDKGLTGLIGLTIPSLSEPTPPLFPRNPLILLSASLTAALSSAPLIGLLKLLN